MKLRLLELCFLSFFLFSCSDKTSGPGEGDLSLEGRVNSLLAKMTIDEKIGQMTQADISALQNINDIRTYSLGSLLAGGSSELNDISASGWANYYDQVQSVALQTRLKIPLLFGIDAVHGHNNVIDAVIFPHNIGLGCTRNPDLIKEAARITAKEIAGTGIDWTFAPCIAVPRDERWGRTYEGFGETPEIQSLASEASVTGFQGTDLSGIESVLACAKHYVADGGTESGDDQGNAQLDEQTLRSIHLPGYIAAIKAGIGSVMASYSSWNGQKLHSHKYLLTDVLKTELKFDGFVVSDWAAVDQISPDYKEAVGIAINAGIDMVMVPNKYKDFFLTMKQLAADGTIPMSRIDDAVKRILRIKFRMGLFERPLTERSLTALVGSQQHREIARQCVRESLVLLKNENSILPLSKNLSRIHVSGKSADDIGNQCGGWTISWQGSSGNYIEGVTVLEAIRNTVSSTSNVTYSIDGTNAAGADIGIVVVGETPYAEGSGDRSDLGLSNADMTAINNIKSAGIPVAVILISGRPMIINDALNSSNAFVAAWLPGTEGQGIADVLFGDNNFKGKLSHSWPRSMIQVPVNYGDSNYDPLFAYGFGLSYAGF